MRLKALLCGLAVAMMLGGHPDWKSIIDRVLALSTDVPAREAANSVLSCLGTLTPQMA